MNLTFLNDGPDPQSKNSLIYTPLRGGISFLSRLSLSYPSPSPGKFVHSAPFRFQHTCKGGEFIPNGQKTCVLGIVRLP
jgi:hypothetical protein